MPLFLLKRHMQAISPAVEGLSQREDMTLTLTALLVREDDGFVALCPEVDVASQGDTVDEAKKNLREAVELFFECASKPEIESRLSRESLISPLEVAVA